MLIAKCNDCKEIIAKEPNLEKEDELIDIGYEHLNEGNCNSFRLYEEDIIERRKDEKAHKELMLYLETISKCPYCPMRFAGTPSEKEKARIEHIKREHPGRRPFIIG